MADNLPNSIATPSAGPSGTPNIQRGPDLSGEIRSEVMGGLEGAIEVTSTQASGQQDDKSVTTKKEEITEEAAIVHPLQSTAVQDIPEATLRSTLRSMIMAQLVTLDTTAQKIRRSNSKSRAFNFTKVISEMRRLNISLSSMYRMALDTVRDLYVKLK